MMGATTHGVKVTKGRLLLAILPPARRDGRDFMIQAYAKADDGNDLERLGSKEFKVSDEAERAAAATWVLAKFEDKHHDDGVSPDATHEDIAQAIEDAWSDIRLPKTSLNNTDEEHSDSALSPNGKYAIRHGKLYAVGAGEDGAPPTYTLLMNAVPRIARDILASDGDGETERRFDVGVTLNGREYSCIVGARDFHGPALAGRLLEAVGPRLLIEPRAEYKLAHAIASFGAPDSEQVRMHTGLYVDGAGHAHYLDAVGDVLAPKGDGDTPFAVRVALPADAVLTAYRLRRDVDPATGWAALQRCLRVAPQTITTPLFAHAYLSPLHPYLETPSRTMAFLSGRTGTRKTELAKLAVGAFGDFQGGADLLTWASTYGAWEAVSHVLKDMLLVIDDYKRAVVRSDLVTRFAQDYSTSTGRQRRRSDMSLLPSTRPRCNILATGEDTPDFEPSVAARHLYIAVEPGDVDLSALTIAQRDATELHGLTVGFVRWLISSADVREALPELLRTYRARLIDALPDGVNVGRVAENIAMLLIAWEALGHYALDAGLMTVAEHDAWVTDGYSNLLKLGTTQIAAVSVQALDKIFIDTLQSLLDQGAVSLTVETGRHTYDGADGLATVGGGAHIGHVSNDGIALFSGETDGGTGVVAYRLVQEHIRRAGESWPHSWKAVGHYLHQNGWLAAVDPDRTTTQRRILGRKRRVVLLKPDALSVPGVPGPESYGHERG